MSQRAAAASAPLRLVSVNPASSTQEPAAQSSTCKGITAPTMHLIPPERRGQVHRLGSCCCAARTILTRPSLALLRVLHTGPQVQKACVRRCRRCLVATSSGAADAISKASGAGSEHGLRGGAEGRWRCEWGGRAGGALCSSCMGLAVASVCPLDGAWRRFLSY